MDVTEAKRLKRHEDKNAKLKKILAEQMLDAAALRELLVKNGRALAAKREGVAHLQAALGLSERRACNVVDADRKMIRHHPLQLRVLVFKLFQPTDLGDAHAGVNFLPPVERRL